MTDLTPDNMSIRRQETTGTPARRWTLARIARRILLVFGTFLILMTLLGVWATWERFRYEKTAVPYLREHIPAVVSWDTDLIWEMFDPRVRAMLDRAELERSVNGFSGLGELQSFGDPVFQGVHATADTDLGAMKRVRYIVPARFETGVARIDITLVDRNGAFSLFHVHISGKAVDRELSEQDEDVPAGADEEPPSTESPSS